MHVRVHVCQMACVLSHPNHSMHVKVTSYSTQFSLTCVFSNYDK